MGILDGNPKQWETDRWRIIGSAHYPYREFAPTEWLRVTFLIDYFTAAENLAAEPGISYLLQTPAQKILFDMGNNDKQQTPSPVEANLAALNLSVDDIDMAVLSHPHHDHMGGNDHHEKNTCGLSFTSPGFVGKPVYVTDPKIKCYENATIHNDGGRILGQGVYLTPAMPAAAETQSKFLEQAVFVSIRGSGGNVLIVGCSHPGILKMVDYVKKLTGLRIDTIIGGLHIYYGEFAETSFGRRKRPSVPSSAPDEVSARAAAAELKNMGVSRVILSGHDCCEGAIKIFAETFGASFRTVRAGESIRLKA